MEPVEEITEEERLVYIRGELVDWVYTVGLHDDFGRAVLDLDDAYLLADYLIENFHIYEKK